jgi:hypothetical protein
MTLQLVPRESGPRTADGEDVSMARG